MLLRLTATSVWSGPSALSRISKARSWSGLASSWAPCFWSSNARLFRFAANSGCSGPRASSRIASDRRAMGIASANLPWL